jgi:phosphate transport system protein
MQASDLTGHISRRFNKDIEDLRGNVLTMGGVVEEQLSRAISAIVSGDSELGLQVAHDDYKVNELEVRIDEECSRILATRAPTAGDLRLIVAIIKTITDLERIGDEAEKIGFLASKLAGMDRPSDSYRELKTLGTHVSHMLRDAMNAFARLDVNESFEVVREDQRVDEEYEAIQRQCITFMMEDPRSIKRVMNVTWAARSLERIGDHAKNICEYVIYMVQGRDVRHTGISDAAELDAE